LILPRACSISSSLAGTQAYFMLLAMKGVICAVDIAKIQDLEQTLVRAPK
jgi:hypothetical protein